MGDAPRPTAEAAGCPICGCFCHVIARSGECGLGRRDGSPAGAPPATIDGRPVTFDAAISRAAEVLAAARYPFVYGLSLLTCEAQRAAVALADRLGACVDIEVS